MRPHLGAGGDVKLHLRLGADHRANIPPIQDSPALGPGKAPLKGHQGRPHLGDHRHPACRLDAATARAALPAEARVATAVGFFDPRPAAPASASLWHDAMAAAPASRAVN